MTRILLTVAAALLAAAAIAHGASDRAKPRECFPAAQWAPAPDSIRPCVRIARLYEDGSFKATVSDADGTIRYSVGVGAQDR